MLAVIGLQAQEDYNKWSVEIGAGANKATEGFAPGYFTETPNFFHAEVGARYMFNNKFGLKLNVGYDTFENADDSQAFDSKFYNASLQGVANLGRILNFETWTNTFGLLAHTGVGYGQLENDNFSGKDQVGTFIVGLTPQIRISNRVTIHGDVSLINNTKQQNTFDGTALTSKRGFETSFYTVSAGLTFNLGKHSKHADWVSEGNRVDDIDARLTKLENGLIDSDQDGVADMYDVEPNSIAGVMVDSKGRMVDANKNGVPDEIERYLDENYAHKDDLKNVKSTAAAEELINQGYINVYFGFNSSRPEVASITSIDFVAKYLKANPSASVDVIGYADEIGNPNYNKELSQKRANVVKDILVNAGIDASRLNSVGNGEDASVNQRIS